MSRTLRGKSLFLWIALIVALADLVTKELVFDSLVDNERRYLSGDWLAFTRVWNPGIMWGQLKEWGFVLRYLRVGAAIVVIAMALTTPANARLVLAALGLVLGGAVGNIYDGFAFGQVRDFIYVDLDVPVFDPFPVFNVADSAICIGVGLLGLSMLRPQPRTESAERLS